MKTVLTTSPNEAARFIKKRGIVAFPTETVYGLGANIFDVAAIEKIFTAKKRPFDNPLIAHIQSLDQLENLVSEISEAAEKLIEKFFPGPLTVVLPKANNVPVIATAGLETIGVRMPRNGLAQAFLSECGTPLVAPSANLSGKPSPTTWEAVYEDLADRIDCILKGQTTEIGIESTVVDCTGEIPLILRTGAVTFEDLQKVIPKSKVYEFVESEKQKSPGLKHKHYSPEARVILVDFKEKMDSPGRKAAFIGLEQPIQGFDLVKKCSSYEDYAYSMYEFFRECDRENIETVYCQEIDEKGIGLAVMDRLRRARAK